LWSNVPSSAVVALNPVTTSSVPLSVADAAFFKVNRF
jgi:hypothetical protein